MGSFLKVSIFSDMFYRFAQELSDKYIAIHLSSESKQSLLNAVPPIYGGKSGKKMSSGRVFADHVTIEPEPDDSLLEVFGEGERVPIKVLGECYDENAQAVIVALPSLFDDYIRNKNRIPHITISTNNKTPPIYSNELVVEGSNFLPLNLTIQGYIKFLSHGKK